MIDAKILIVDDQEEILFLLETILSKLSCQIDTMSNSKMVIDHLGHVKYDLIILDIMMPDIDGIELCGEIKKLKSYEDVPIIFISALDNEESIVKAFDIGANDYITKPIKKQEVLSRVKNQLLYKIKYTSLINTMQFAFHELKTPINIIQNDLYLLELAGSKQHHIDRMSMALQALESIYDDIYYSVKQDDIALQLDKIDLIKIINKYIKKFDTILNNKNIKINTLFEDDKIIIQMPHIAFERLITNTFSNAIKYSNSGGEIDIVVKQTNDLGVYFAVINDSNTKTDFNKFFKTGLKEHKSIKGMGIGLEIIRNICISYDIDVNVKRYDTKVEFGYTFYPKLNHHKK
jgi:two-component system, sensor histidine kinase and response regulator